jgi:hypothetical protein
MKEKPTAGSPFFAAFLFYRIHTATKDANVNYFIHSTNFYKLYQRIPGTFFEATVCNYHESIEGVQLIELHRIFRELSNA